MKQFDKHADAYNVVRGKIAYPDSLYRNLAERAPAREAALDIGCGNGVSTVRLQPWFRYVEGSDLGEALIAKARENYPGIRFSVSPAKPSRRNAASTWSPAPCWRVPTCCAGSAWRRSRRCGWRYRPASPGPRRGSVASTCVVA